MAKIRLAYVFYILSILLFAMGCTSKSAKKQLKAYPPIFPDYKNVTVPSNIAPLNFYVEGATALHAEFCHNQVVLFSVDGTDEIQIPKNKWLEALKQCQNGKLEVYVSEWNSAAPDGVAYRPFVIYVSPDKIDPWIAYRLIPPGYELWNHMGIFQRSLETFNEKNIVSNEQNNKGCINCHSFCNYSPDNMLFHARGQKGTTVLVRNKKVSRLDLKTLPPYFSGTYPCWHPNEQFIAFSNNTTHQAFYDKSHDKVEVYDLASDLMIYDLEQHKVLTDNRFTDSLHWETFPAFSPKGNYLYFCRAIAKLMPKEYKELKYALLRVPFNAVTGELGEPIDTLYNPTQKGGSASFPRISPDGKHLLFTESDCATFPIWHKEADLKMINLESGKEEDTSLLNSKETDSYHSWSSNGRWIIFSSRRIDGRYTRLFIAHMDKKGKFGKPFLLPQKSATSNTLQLESYNIPEFIQEEVKLNKNEIADLFK